MQIRGRGMVLGIDMSNAGGRDRAAEVQRECFAHRLILEVCGREDEVVKVMPPLNVDSDRARNGAETS